MVSSSLIAIFWSVKMPIQGLPFTVHCKGKKMKEGRKGEGQEEERGEKGKGYLLCLTVGGTAVFYVTRNVSLSSSIQNLT